MNIYNISANYQALLDKDDYTSDDMHALELAHDDFEDRSVQVAAYILNLQAEMNGVLDAQKKMYERAKKIEMKIDTLKNYLKTSMEHCNISKITKSPAFVISVRNNPPSVYIDDESVIPPGYIKLSEVKTIDKTMIKNAIVDGRDVAGARLVKNTRLDIK